MCIRDRAYANYKDLMTLTQELIQFVAREVNGTTVTHFNGIEIDLAKWEKLTMREAIIKWWWEDAGPAPTIETFASPHSFMSWLNTVIERMDPQHKTFLFNAGFLGIKDELEKGGPLGKAIADVFEWVAEQFLIQPTIIYEFPLAVSPLSKQKPDEPDWVERFEFYLSLIHI